MQYKVIKSFKGSPDGRFAVDYTEGQTVPLTDSLAQVALAEGWVEAVPEQVEADLGGAPDAAPQGGGSAKKSKQRGNK